MKEIFLMRHGKTRENELGIIIGRSDPPLSEEGRKELHSIKQYVTQPDIIFSSDLRRSSETAEILFPDMEIILLPQLRERDYGILEGKSVNDIRVSWFKQTEDEAILKKYGIETSASVIARVNNFLSLISEVDAQKIMVIGHGSFFTYTIKVLLSEDPIRPSLKNLHYHKIVLDEDRKVIDAKFDQSWNME